MKKKEGNIILVIGLIILVIGLTLSQITRNNSKNKEEYSKELTELMNKKKKYGELISIEYSVNKEKTSDIDRISLIKNNNKFITTTEKTNKIDTLEINEYNVNKRAWDNLEETINKYNIPYWSTIKNKNNEVEEEKILTLTYQKKDKNNDLKKEIYVIDYNTNLPHDAYKIYDDIIFALKSTEKEENLITVEQRRDY